MKIPVRIASFVAFAACGFLGSVPAMAADPAPATTLQRERAACDGVQQDRAACLREAGAARQEARRDGLTDAGPKGEQENALARCAAQPPAARAECEARIRGTGKTTVEGSVMGGGMIRETVTPIPAKKP